MFRHCLISTLFSGALLIATGMLVSCTADGNSDNGGSATGAGGTGAEAPTLQFFADEASDVPLTQISLVPGEEEVFGVKASPPGSYRVRFSLVPLAEAPPHDGSLDRTDALTDAVTGIAHVKLRAPSVVTDFSLQASIGSTSTATLVIKVQSPGWAELQVVPDYAGQRRVSQWVANAYFKVLCSELENVTVLDHGLPADSQYTTTIVSGTPPRLEVPVQPNMAVTVRAGHYLFGCQNVDQPPANVLTTVSVPVSDLPIQLAGADLLVTLGVSETSEEWLDHLQAAADQVLLAFTVASENDVSLLFDTMQELIESDGDRMAFEAARATANWEVRALPSLDKMDGLLLRNALAEWMVTGSRALSDASALVTRLRSAPEGDGPATLEVLRVANVDAEHAGFQTENDVTWNAIADDTVALGTSLKWSPTTLVTALAEAQAIAEYSDADTLGDAFAALIDCRVLADSLLEPEAASVFGDCDTGCVANLCQSALQELEDRIWQASDEEQTLQLSATGSAQVDDEAHAIAFTGSWRGTFPSGESAAVGGTVEAEEYLEPAE